MAESNPPSNLESHLETNSESSTVSEESSLNAYCSEDKDWETLVTDIDALVDLTKDGYKKDTVEVSIELLETIINTLGRIHNVFLEMKDDDIRKEYAEKIFSQKPNLVSTVAPFIRQVYKCVSNGYELKCLIDWTHLVIIWTNCCENMRNFIIKESVHIQLIIQLLDLHSATTEHQEILADLISLSMLLLLTLIEHQEIRHHFKNCYYADILISYLPSKNFSISKLAKISLAILHRYLDKTQATKYLQLSSNDIAIVLKILTGQELNEMERKENWQFMSKDGLAVIMRSFCYVEENCRALFEHNGLTVLTDVLNDTNLDTDSCEGILLLLWKLISVMSADQKSAVFDKLRILDFSDKEKLQTLLTCVLISLQDIVPEDGDNNLKLYVEMAYKHELYEECIHFCQRAHKKGSSINHTVSLFHAKSLYHIFKQELQFLKDSPIASKVHNDARLSCFKKIKEVIRLLGLVFDKEDVSIIDDEGSRMLDMAMMISLSELRDVTGKLQRCLLCRKKAKLAKSHICPKAILDDMSKASGSPGSGKAFFVSWPWQKMFTGNIKSAGELTVRVLCHDCEGVLSKAEAKFLPGFFRKFYSMDRPESIKEEHVIEYQEWLYQFCISLIFRGMVLQYSGGRGEFQNEDEVYDMFLQCRRVLLHPSIESRPVVSVFIAPTQGDASEINSSLINICLHYLFHFFFSQKQYMYGSHQLYLEAFSYTFQTGMILTTVQFSKANWSVDSSLIINPDCGVYKIPFDEQRRAMIPDQLWETILAEAMTIEKEVMEQPKKAIVLQPLDDLLAGSPLSYMHEIFDITKRSEGMRKGSLLEGHPKIVNFMPEEYKVFHPTAKNSSAGTIRLPNLHKILLHLNVYDKDHPNCGQTAFIVVGDSKSPFTVESPYLLFHRYEPGFQENTTFFFSPDSLEFLRYLPEPNPKRFLGDDATTDLTEKSSAIVSIILKNKGYRNYQSLLYWLQSRKSPALLDMKCKEQGCWYCKDLCEICLEQAILGPSLSLDESRKLKFCSNECIQFYNVTPEPHSMVFTPEEQLDSTKLMVPKGHKEYLRIFSNGKLEDESGGCFVTSFSLCEGDGSVDFPLGTHYVNYYLRTPDYQCHYEYFISNDLIPLDGVSYNDSSLNLFEEEECKDIMSSSINIMQGIFERSGLSSISQFMRLQEFIASFSGTEYGMAGHNVERSLHTMTEDQLVEALSCLMMSEARHQKKLSCHETTPNHTTCSIEEVYDETNIEQEQPYTTEYIQFNNEMAEKPLTSEEYRNHSCFVS